VKHWPILLVSGMRHKERIWRKWR